MSMDTEIPQKVLQQIQGLAECEVARQEVLQSKSFAKIVAESSMGTGFERSKIVQPVWLMTNQKLHDRFVKLAGKTQNIEISLHSVMKELERVIDWGQLEKSTRIGLDRFLEPCTLACSGIQGDSAYHIRTGGYLVVKQVHAPVIGLSLTYTMFNESKKPIADSQSSTRFVPGHNNESDLLMQIIETRALYLKENDRPRWHVKRKEETRNGFEPCL